MRLFSRRSAGILFLSCTFVLFGLAADRAGAQDRQTTLRQHVPADAGSSQAPLLFCIGLHIEPLGARVSDLVPREGATTGPGRGAEGRSNRPGRPGPGGGSGLPAPDYANEHFFGKHLQDIRQLIALVERHRGCITAQAQTPFTRTLAASGDTLFSDLERDGHEVALHFHEDAHMGRNGERLPVATWAAVMKEEIDLIRRCGATRISYWSGGNLYPGVLEAARGAGLSVMSDYKNPKLQDSHSSVLGVHPWRPAGGPIEGDLTKFSQHDPNGPILYLPDGIFSKTNFAGMRRSEETGGDWAYFDYLTTGLEASLRAARPDRVNVFHLTVHPAEFRGRGGEPFAVIDAWLSQVIDPLVKSGKVQWATFRQMADAVLAWEKRHPDENPRIAAARVIGTPDKSASAPAAGQTPIPSAADAPGYMTFAVNVHDTRFHSDSARAVLRAIDLFERHAVRGDFYLTGPIAETYAQSHPEVVTRLRDSHMTISYHVRPPHPLVPGFDQRLQGLSDAELARTLRDYETYRLDPTTGALDRSAPGGYTQVAKLFGRPPVVASPQSKDPRIRAAALALYREMGAQVMVQYHEEGTDPDQPLVFVDGMLVRPSDFSVTRWKAGKMQKDNFWWNQQTGPFAEQFRPVAYLQQRLDAWRGSRRPFITALIHENNFYNAGPEGWTAVYYEGEDKSRPKSPPWDLTAPTSAKSRSKDEQERIWHEYDALVAWSAAHLHVVTSEDLVRMAVDGTW